MTKVNYNEISQVYDDVREADVELINHLLQEIDINSSTRILDIGCGTGLISDEEYDEGLKLLETGNGKIRGTLSGETLV